MSGLVERLGSHAPWTVDDLPDDGRRWELVDGVPVVSPPPSGLHAVTVNRLAECLRGSVDSRRVFQDLGIGVSPAHYRVPDLVVVRPEIDVSALSRLAPEHVTLAVEVVSPSTVTTDRITKPAQYASWGISSYWRVELDPCSLTVHQLSDGERVYAVVGSWRAGQTAELTEPFTVRLAVDRLVS